MAGPIFLLDTNILSNAGLQRPPPGLRAWMKAMGADSLAISFPAIAELRRGAHLALKHDPQKAQRLHNWIDDILSVDFQFAELTAKAAKPLVIVEGKCGLNLPEELRTDDFLGRLCAANSGCYGKIIEAVQAACFLVMHKGKGTVDRRAFAHNYQRDTGCLPSDNVFTAARWSEIDPGNALADLATAGKGGK